MKYTLLALLIIFSASSVCGSEIRDVAAKYRAWIVGSDSVNYADTQVSHRYDAILKYVEYGVSTYDNFEFDASVGFEFSTKDNQTEARDILSDILFPITLGYHLESAPDKVNPYFHNAQILEKLMSLYDYLYAKGWKTGIDMEYGKMDTYMSTGVIGFGGSMGNNFLGYSLSVFLNKEILADEGRLKQELETLNWITNVVGPQYDFPVLWEVGGYNADGVRSMFNSRLAYVLSLPEEDAERENEMLYFQRLFDKSLQVSDGFADLIKADFMGYHHKGAYINAYAPNAFHTAAIMAYMLEGSAYQISEASLSNLGNAILTTRIYSNKYDVPRGLAGRFPDNLGGLLKNQPYFYYMSQVETPLKAELAGAFMRLWDVSAPDFEDDLLESVTCAIMYQGSIGAIDELVKFAGHEQVAETTPNGFWYKPYGGLAIYRQGEWMVTWKGNSRYIWDYESSNNENRYGRFASAGVMRIYADGSPISAEASGYVDDGWNWSRPQGATCYDMETTDFDGDNDRNFTVSPFLGGVTIDGEAGLVAMDYQDPLSTLQAYESLFFIDDYVFSLGSNVSTSEADFPLHTTLFQSAIQGQNTTITVDGEVKEKAAFANTSISLDGEESHTLIDPYGHAYRVAQGMPIAVDISTQQSMSDNGKKSTSGNFATARVVHGNTPKNAGYEYVVQVKGGSAGALILAEKKDSIYSVIRKDETAHIIEYLPKQVKAYAIFEGGAVLDDDLLIQADVPCLVMISNSNDNEMQMGVSNPDLGKFDESIAYNEINSKETWHKSSTVQPTCITLEGYWKLKKADDNISLVNTPELTTEITFQCFDGQSICSELLALDTFIANDKVPGFGLYPNPTQGDMWLDNPSRCSGVLQIYDVSGRCVFNSELTAMSKQKIDISLLPIGVYTLQVTSELLTETIKFVRGVM